MPEVTWNLFFLLSTIQKILPLYLFEQIIEQTRFIWVIIGLIFGVAGGLRNLKIKKILGYSSIFTLAWALAAKNFSLGIGFIFIYAVALAFLTYKINWRVRDKINRILEVSHYSSTITVLLALLRIAGIPPLVGFVAKLLVLQELVKLEEFGLILALTQTSVLFVFIYLKLFLSRVTWGKNLTILSQFSKLVELLGPILLRSGVLLFLLLHNKCLCIKNFEFLGL